MGFSFKKIRFEKALLISPRNKNSKVLKVLRAGMENNNCIAEEEKETNALKEEIEASASQEMGNSHRSAKSMG